MATLFFSFGFLSFVAQAKTQFRSECLLRSIALQRKIILAEKKLFKLNPLSTSLQLQFDITTAGLIAALETGNPILIAELNARLNHIKAEQVQLDGIQKAFISSGQILIQLDQTKINTELLTQANSLGHRWIPFLTSFFNISPAVLTQFSVRPVRSGLAPNYELNPNYKRLQKVAFIWQTNYRNQYQTQSENQRLIESANSFSLTCEASPNLSEGQWSIEI